MEETQNLVLELLRAIRADIASVKEDTREIKSRVTSLEHGMLSVRREVTSNYADIVDAQERHDRLVTRIERIEKRLELT